jgi:hypothetical protein
VIWKQREGAKKDDTLWRLHSPQPAGLSRRTGRTEMKTSRFIAFVGVLLFAFSLNWMPQPQAESKNNCQHISGHIDGQVIGTSRLCDGALTETGTFTDSGATDWEHSWPA